MPAGLAVRSQGARGMAWFRWGGHVRARWERRQSGPQPGRLRRISKRETPAEELDGIHVVTEGMQKSDRTKEVLRTSMSGLWVFESLTAEEVDRCVALMEIVVLGAGETLMEEGGLVERMYIVETGSLDFFLSSRRMESRGPGSAFGELGLIHNVHCSNDVIATSDTVLWSLDRRSFRSLKVKSSMQRTEAVMQALKRVDLLNGMTEHQMEKVADAVQVLKFPAKARIITKGTVGEEFFMIQSGSVVVRNIGETPEGGVELDDTLHGGSSSRAHRSSFKDVTLEAGDYFGERALLTGELRSANVFAKSDLTVLRIQRTDFEHVLGPLKELLEHNVNVRTISALKLLTKLTEREREQTAKMLRVERHARGADIIKEGTHGEAFYILKSGSAKVVVDRLGKRGVVSILHAGVHFGEMALLGNEKRTATITAIEDCECFVLDKRTFAKSFGNLHDIMAREARATYIKVAPRADVELQQLEDIGVLGAGNYGSVALVMHRRTKETFALKRIRKASIVTDDSLLRGAVLEKKLMSMCDHPFVGRLLNTYRDETQLYMLLEFMQGGQLCDVPKLSRRGVRFYAAGIALGVAHLHSMDIVHRDVKPENVTIDHRGYPRIIDFGLAKVVKHKTFTLCGTPEFLAPEIILGRGYGAAVDWWAFGVLIYEIVVGRNPFADPFADGEDATLRNVLNAPLNFSSSFDPACRDLISRLLCRFPLQRLGSGVDGRQQVHEHRYFKKLNMAALLAQRAPAPRVPSLKNNMDRSHFAPPTEPVAKPESDDARALANSTNWEVWDYFNVQDEDGSANPPAAEPGSKSPGTKIAVISDDETERGGIDMRPACSLGCNVLAWRDESELASHEGPPAKRSVRFEDARAPPLWIPSLDNGPLCYSSPCNTER